MKELKFRAWDKDGVEYVDGVGKLYVDILEVGTKVFCIEQMCPGRYIFEQYTGLKDKNGKEIYEGDIVSEEFVYRDEKVKTIWQVRWCDDECAFELHYASGFEIDDCSLDADEEDYKVIGNIHENLELLEDINVLSN